MFYVAIVRVIIASFEAALAVWKSWITDEAGWREVEMS